MEAWHDQHLCILDRLKALVEVFEMIDPPAIPIDRRSKVIGAPTRQA